LSLKIQIDKLPECDPIAAQHLFDGDPSGIVAKYVRGYGCSMGVVTRSPGHHSRPHAREGEQLNYVQCGELSIFMEGHEYRLAAGDFMNIPSTVAHWTWNRGDVPCVVIESHTPAHAASDPFGLFAPGEPAPIGTSSPTFWLSDAYAQGEAEFPPASDDCPWRVRARQVRSNPVNQTGRMHAIARNPDSGKLDTLFVYGESANMLVATRGGGYHSKPHVHRSEQLNLVLSGEVSIFVSGICYRLKPGDFFRVPGMAEHWAWNETTEPCVLAEVHTPVLSVALPDPVPLLPKERLPFVVSTKSLYFEPPSAEEEAAMVARAQ
jgi:mannose-6-phosphate isomerase-like protein (cupin superfamily)